MKPFDLEEYKKNPSREVVTKGGKKVRILCTDRKEEKCPIVALVQENGGEMIYAYSEKGEWHFEHGSDNDLFFASVKHKGWINIYESDKGFMGVHIYKTEEEAKDGSCFGRVDTVPIEWEE